MAILLKAIREHLTSKTIGKYLLYVVGEIVLVVIGILLAMKISAWNEAKATREAEQTFLKALKIEMEGNTKKLKTAMEYNSKSRDAAYRLVEIYNSDYRRESHAVLDSLFAQVQWAWTFDPELSVLNSIKANGNIKTIQSPEIQSFINSFEESVKDASEESQITRSVIINSYVMKVSEYISMNLRVKRMGYPITQSKFPSDYEGIFNDREVESLLTYIYIWRVSEIEEFGLLQKELERNSALVEKAIH